MIIDQANQIQQLKQKNKIEITILGSGIIGLCSALYLQQEGYKITIIDRNPLGNGASIGNAGHIASYLIEPLSNPDVLKNLPKLLFDKYSPLSIPYKYMLQIAPWLWQFVKSANLNQVNKSIKALYNLNKYALDAYKPLLKLADADNLLIQGGTISVFESEKLFNNNLKKLSCYQYNDNQDYINNYGLGLNPVDYTILKYAELKELEPNLNPNIKNGILYKNGAYITNLLSLSQKFLNIFLEHGGRFVQDEIKNIEYNNDCIKINAQNKIYKTNKVIIALGAWSKNIANQLGYKVPLETDRGYHIMLRNTNQKGIINNPIVFTDRGFVLTPMEHGTRIVGITELGGLQLPVNNRKFEILKYHTQSVINKPVDFDDCSKWMGFRPTLPDSVPVISKASKHPDIYFAFGNQHLGLTQGAITGKLVRDLVLNINQKFLEPYSIDRF